MTSTERAIGIRRLKMAYAILATLPGIPTIFYGDEAGLEGYGDPFCRRPYPWGNEDRELLDFYRQLGRMRRGTSCLKDGDFRAELCGDNCAIKIIREGSGEKLIAVVSRAESDIDIALDGEYKNAMTGEKVSGSVTVSSDSAVILIRK